MESRSQRNWQRLNAIAMLTIAAFVAGCRQPSLFQFLARQYARPSIAPKSIVDQPPVSLKVERPADDDLSMQLPSISPPVMTVKEMPGEFWDMSLDEVIELGLSNTKVLRNLGGRVLTNPDSEPTMFEPSLQESDPIFGAQAALAQFDARFNSALQYAANDDVFNNSILGGGAREVLQDLGTYRWSVEKTNAIGTRYAYSTQIRNDQNNSPGNLFDTSWTAVSEATIRQPLLQGRGAQFNRIAGPNAQPGFRTTAGILISRVNQDISVGQLEFGVTQFVRELLGAYWDLYFAYRNYESAQHARDTAATTWRLVRTRYDNDLPGGEADKEAQAREQLFLFDLQLESALNGDPRRGITGVLQAEANLRRLLGLSQSGDRFIRPTDGPIDAKFAYDWNELVQLAFQRRVELRTQSWRIKRRQLELVAAKNFLQPRLDATLTYRNNGFGDRLAGGTTRFSSAATDYFSGNHQEWEAGLEFTATLGYRQAFAAVRNAELALMRDRAIRDEQQKQIVYELGSALRRMERTYSTMQIAYNRMLAARQTVESRTAAFEADTVPADQLLDAQQRLADAESEFYRSQTDYAVAQLDVQTESGALLPQFGLSLSEADNTYRCAENDHYRWTMAKNARVNYRLSSPGFLSKGDSKPQGEPSNVVPASLPAKDD